MAARPLRPLTAVVVSALASLAACSSGGGGGRALDDDPRGVNERVRELVQRFSYGDAGPYGSTSDDGAFGGDAGGPFEGADSPGLIGPPAAAAGAYERTNPCDAYCSFVAGCFDVQVPTSCVDACSVQVREVSRVFGEGCAGPLLELYACVAGVLICDRDSREDQQGEPEISISDDLLNRCGSALEGLRVCVNRPELDLDEILVDDEDDDDQNPDPPNGTR
jgi:hypothetical protein